MSSIMDRIESLPDVSFINSATMEEVQAELIKDYQEKYEELTGKSISLGKADPNRLILYACAVQIYQGFMFVDRAGKQDLLKYSYGEFLENLAALKGITRNEAIPAKAIIRFTLSASRPSAVSIPEGTRVTDNGQEIYFQTTEYNEIPARETYIDIEMTCTTDGKIGNGFLVGEIDTLVDPIPYVASVTNTEVTEGGTEIESDISLAERTYLAPASYSVAGPDDAYTYWTKTFNQNITDVKVASPIPGEVDIRFILTDGNLPDRTMIAGLQSFLEDRQIRPLTDHVTVSAPDIVDYKLNVKYFINSTDTSRAVTIQAEVNAAIQEYIEWQKTVIGRDINPSYLTKLIVAAGAKRVEVRYPEYEIIPDTSVANLTAQTVTYGGIEDD